jgi:hypothetical protein
MGEFDKYINCNYYSVYDELQELAKNCEMFTSLVENNINYNIDENPDRILVYINNESIITRFVLG